MATTTKGFVRKISMAIIQFPYSASRPRTSRTGTPEGRTAKAEAVVTRDELERLVLANLLAKLNPRAYEIAMEEIKKIHGGPAVNRRLAPETQED